MPTARFVLSSRTLFVALIVALALVGAGLVVGAFAPVAQASSAQVYVYNYQWGVSWNAEDWPAAVSVEWTSQYIHTSTAKSGNVPVETPPSGQCAEIYVYGWSVYTNSWVQLAHDRTCN